MSTEDIYTQIARLRTRRTMSHFATASDYKIHGEGYREAISDMAELAHQESRLATPSPANGAVGEMPEPADGERTLFEREMLRLDISDDEYMIRRHDGSYVDDSDQAAWMAWQAARALPAINIDQEPVAYLKFWAAQSWGGSGNHDIECGEGLEVCEKGDVGADKLPAMAVYSADQLLAAVLAERAEIVAILENRSEGWESARPKKDEHENMCQFGAKHEARALAEAIRART